jgi:hypothetical protein
MYAAAPMLCLGRRREIVRKKQCQAGERRTKTRRTLRLHVIVDAEPCRAGMFQNVWIDNVVRQ